MDIIKRYAVTNSKIVGRLSDGSDREEIQVTEYFVECKDEDNVYKLRFNYEPTDEEINNAYKESLYQFISLMTIDEFKKYKINKIKLQCKDRIEVGFNSQCKYTEGRHYTLKDYEQSNMQALKDMVKSGMQIVPWRDISLSICESYTAAEFLQLCNEAFLFITQTRFKSDALEVMINESNDVDYINSLSMNSELPTDKQTYIDNIINQMVGGVNG